MPTVLLALLFSVVAAAGSLYLSLGLGLQACPLCFYQRTFAFVLIGLLLAGLALPNRDPGVLCVLALPPAVGGLGVAGFHTYLVVSGKLECPLGIADLGSAPVQSLAVFVLVTLTLVVGAGAAVRENGRRLPAAVLAALLGLIAAYGSTVANPMPKPPAGPYPAGEKVLTCRVPYHP